MFITEDAYRSPLSILRGCPTENYWTIAELALRQPWYVVTYSHVDPEEDDSSTTMSRSLLLSKVADVETFAQLVASQQLQCESILIITPNHINNSDTWKMERLGAVWMAEEPAAPGQMVEIFETLEGVMYVRSMLGTPLKKLRNKILRFRVSQGKQVSATHFK